MKKEQEIYEYQYEPSYEGEDSDEESNDQYQHFDSQNQHQLYTESEDLSGHHESQSIIKEINADQLYEEISEESIHEPKKYFDKTLTNMRIAFGSEQQVRENSVKTLEKMETSNDASGSGNKTEEKSSIFEKKSFQDFSLKKFTELMQVKNMKNFQTSMQKTFREYTKGQILSASDTKENNRTSSTPKKQRYVSPRRSDLKDLTLDRIGYERMKLNSEKKDQWEKKMMSSSSSHRKYNTSILYKANLSMEKCKKEMNMEDFNDEVSNSVSHLEYKTLSPNKAHKTCDARRSTSDKKLLQPMAQPTFDSPEPTKSYRSKVSSCQKAQAQPDESVKSGDEDEKLYEDENICTVKLDSSRLRSQKRGLPIDKDSDENEETPKCTATQRRVANLDENCYTGEKYVLGDCFTDEKLHQMKIRNAVTSAKKINPLQIMKDLKSPAASSYISSAKKALIRGQDIDEDERIELQLSDSKPTGKPGVTGKENFRSENSNILIERFEDDEVDTKKDPLKNFVNANQFEKMDQDYNDLESPEKSHHKHSKSRSRTKEKRRNKSEEGEEYYNNPEYQGYEDNTCMMIDFTNSPESKSNKESKDLEETSKSLEWILAKNIDKKKREEICKIIGEEESRPQHQTEDTENMQSEDNAQELEVEEVKSVKFGNSMIQRENIGQDYQEDKNESNLGQYIE